MNAAGSKGSKIASKYRAKGLRVIAIDMVPDYKQNSVKKWKDAGADFYLYDNDMNCLKPFYKDVSGYPTNISIKEGKGKLIGYANVGEAEVKNAFGF